MKLKTFWCLLPESRLVLGCCRAFACVQGSTRALGENHLNKTHWFLFIGFKKKNPSEKPHPWTWYSWKYVWNESGVPPSPIKHNWEALESASVVLGVPLQCALVGSTQFFPRHGDCGWIPYLWEVSRDFGLDQSWLSQAPLSHSFCCPLLVVRKRHLQRVPTDSNQEPKTNFIPLQPSLGEDSCWAFLTLVNKSCLVCFTKEPQVFWAPN